MYICICNISYKLTQKHIAWCKFFTIFKERKIERKKKEKTRTRTGLEQREKKMNKIIQYFYTMIICILYARINYFLTS